MVSGFFDVNVWLTPLGVLGEQSGTYGRVADFEATGWSCRVLYYSRGAHGGRPPCDPVMMLKDLVIQTANNLSDE